MGTETFQHSPSHSVASDDTWTSSATVGAGEEVNDDFELEDNILQWYRGLNPEFKIAYLNELARIGAQRSGEKEDKLHDRTKHIPRLQQAATHIALWIRNTSRQSDILKSRVSRKERRVESDRLKSLEKENNQLREEVVSTKKKLEEYIKVWHCVVVVSLNADILRCSWPERFKRRWTDQRERRGSTSRRRKRRQESLQSVGKSCAKWSTGKWKHRNREGKHLTSVSHFHFLDLSWTMVARRMSEKGSSDDADS